MDTGGYLATVGKEYHVVQNRDLFAILDPLIQQGLVDIEVMGAIRGGSQVWGLCRVKQLPQEVVDRLAMTGDVLRTYIMAFGSHDTTSCLELSNTNVRTVCANTCDLSRLRFPGVKIPHRANALARLEEAARTLWGNLQVSMLEQAKDAATLRRFAPLSKEQFSIAVLDEIAPAPDAIKKEEYLNWSTYQRARDIVADKRATVRRLWTYGQGHLGDYSAWEAYNGAVEALDHHDRQFRSRDRISSMLNGPIFQAKRNIRTNLLRLAEAA
jgi:phage/plasmid-like protein (TIGR03299 family)